MDKFKMLKNEISNAKIKYQDKIKETKQAIANTDAGVLETSIFLVEELKYCSDKLCSLERKEKHLARNEKRLRIMLEGFYDDGFSLISFVYEDIHRLFPSPYAPYNQGFRYEVKGSHFILLAEAKAHSMALGERKDWLLYAYKCI